jgi:hypothetical protein
MKEISSILIENVNVVLSSLSACEGRGNAF